MSGNKEGPLYLLQSLEWSALRSGALGGEEDSGQCLQEQLSSAHASHRLLTDELVSLGKFRSDTELDAVGISARTSQVGTSNER